MSSQIFKNKIPIEMLFDLLDKIALKNNNSFIINNNVYKKGIYNGLIQEFIEQCKPFYHNSKRKYLERQINYNSFITIIRQICRINKINYDSHIKYNNSIYDIVYNIYFTKN